MRTRRGGFTLIELLASMAILMVIVWVLAAIFRESDRAWAMGTGRVDNNMEGRALIQMIANDLQYAICDENMTFIIQDERNKTTSTSGYITYGHTNSEICFVNLSEDATPSGGQATRHTGNDVLRSNARRRRPRLAASVSRDAQRVQRRHGKERDGAGSQLLQPRLVHPQTERRHRQPSWKIGCGTYHRLQRLHTEHKRHGHGPQLRLTRPW
jgi:prepilin-type N-terminal cleavage/methylation domain-containing protein